MWQEEENFEFLKRCYLTIIPWAQMGHESIAHEAEKCSGTQGKNDDELIDIKSTKFHADHISAGS